MKDETGNLKLKKQKANSEWGVRNAEDEEEEEDGDGDEEERPLSRDMQAEEVLAGGNGDSDGQLGAVCLNGQGHGRPEGGRRDVGRCLKLITRKRARPGYVQAVCRREDGQQGARLSH